MQNYKLRVGKSDDLLFLKEMLYEAVFWDRQENRPSLEELFANPEIAKILQNWNEREGDFSLIAVDEFDKLLGAAWYRFWTSSNHSYGFVDEDTPELGIAVKLEVRRMGIGKTLMNAVMKHAGEIGIKRMSLSVDPNNHARKIYEKLGFRKIGVVGTSWTMVATL